MPFQVSMLLAPLFHRLRRQILLRRNARRRHPVWLRRHCRLHPFHVPTVLFVHPLYFSHIGCAASFRPPPRRWRTGSAPGRHSDRLGCGLVSDSGGHLAIRLGMGSNDFSVQPFRRGIQSRCGLGAAGAQASGIGKRNQGVGEVPVDVRKNAAAAGQKDGQLLLGRQVLEPAAQFDLIWPTLARPGKIEIVRIDAEAVQRDAVAAEGLVGDRHCPSGRE